MRENKYRFWDLHAQEIIYNDEFYALSMEGVPLQLYSDSYPEYRKDLIPLRYTGLKDKNGKEIYEGDIVCCGKILDFVEFSCGAFSLNNTWGSLTDYTDEMEILGNIYENPELLEKEKAK